MNRLYQWLRALMQSISNWWMVDRIRIARSDGRLFQLKSGQRLLIGQEFFVVVQSQGKLVNDEAHFSISLKEFETDRTQLWYLEHHASCASLATFDDAAWRLKDPNGGCVEVDSDSVICFSLNSN